SNCKVRLEQSGNTLSRRHSSRPRLNVEKAEDFSLGQAQRWRRAVLLKQLGEKLPFAFEDVGDAILDGSLGDETGDENRGLLADAVGAIDGLVLHRRVPPAIEQENIVGELQVEPDAAGAIAHQENVLFRIVLEAFQQSGALTRWNLAVELKRAERGQSFR